MNYSFDVRIAKYYGVDEAILINNFYFWYAKNKANGDNFKDDRYWTYNSSRAFAELFPFWSQSKIKRLLSDMVSRSILHKSCYNKLNLDRTSWYSLSDEVLKDLGEFSDCSDLDNAKCENEPTIPVVNSPDIYKTKNNGANPVCTTISLYDSQNIFESTDDLSLSVRDFMSFYPVLYKAYRGESHPAVTLDQATRCFYALCNFASDTDIEIQELNEMVKKFFENVKNSNHSILHFCTPGILENRMYEAGLV